ncbi:hypothetical protein [Spongiactinospora sp. 9N601]|uniref:hypothetical protein n=1 Tax=Spongiactinospora sp. 9N601 TaxID=3375149 RepID=UPI0037B30460
MSGAAAVEPARRGDDDHAAGLRARTARRLAGLVELLDAHGLPGDHPEGGPFVWLPAPGGDGVAFGHAFAARTGLVVAPGIGYGPSGGGHVRLAAVQEPEVLRPRLAAWANGPAKERNQPYAVK